MKISLIVAMSENRVIGRGGDLPWHLPEDLRRFRRLTTGRPVIMGRKTHESIGRLLPERENIIITRQRDYQVPGATVVASFDEALDRCAHASEVFVIGGGEIYRLALSRADRVYLTLIHGTMEGDTYFPELPAGVFLERERHTFDRPIRHSYITLERRESCHD